MSPGTPRMDPGDMRTRLIELADVYNAGTLGHDSPFFPAPGAPAVKLVSQGDGPLGTQVVDLTFPSDYTPFHPWAREMYLGYTANLTAYARWWTSHRGRPTVVLIHGWGVGEYRSTAQAFMLPYWLRHGYDVVAFQMPFHGARAPEGRSLLRGHSLFPSPNPLRMNEAFGHAIYDLRALAMFLRSRGTSAVGALGMSLGGYTAALWASVAGVADVGGLDFSVAMIPAVSFSHLMWKHGEATAARRRATNAGVTEDLLADAFRVHSPITRAPRLPSERLLVVAGKGDRITPPDQAAALAAHWGVDILWFDGGHLVQLGRGDALREVRRRLGALALPGRAFRS
jgi:pimeloyl-ACP methyl ester carboxylesterase